MSELGDALGTKLIDSEMLDSIIKKVQYIIEHPPTMTCVNVVLNEGSALKYEIVKSIISRAGNLNDNEAAWYILMSGIENELKKITVAGTLNQDGINN